MVEGFWSISLSILSKQAIKQHLIPFNSIDFSYGLNDLESLKWKCSVLSLSQFLSLAFEGSKFLIHAMPIIELSEMIILK